MIALNEIVKNKEYFINKYKQMGKSANLDSIVFLEEKYSKLQLEAKNNRSNCNKLCSQVAEQINDKKDVSVLISQINTLDNFINKQTKILDKMYAKINKKLRKLHNPARCENLLNLHIKTKAKDYSVLNFINEINKISTINIINDSIKKYLKTREDYVFTADNLPMIIKYKNKITILATKEDCIQIYDNLVKQLKDNSKVLIQKSIRQLKKQSTDEYRATLSDNSVIDLRLVEEFYSREYSLKYTDKKSDMSKFLNQIDINIYTKNLTTLIHEVHNEKI